MDVASWLIVNRARCSLIAKALSGCVCVGREEVRVADIKMERQMRLARVPGYPHCGSRLISGLSYKTAFSNDGLVSLICPTCQMSTSALDECRLLCMGLFSIFWLGAPEAPPCPSAASGRLHHLAADEATARGLEPSPYFPSGFSIFTSSPCTNSLPQITCPVFSGSSLPSMPEMVPPASRTMICPAAMSQGCKLRSQ
jgi:hypothetical protein